ncbi:vascular cell adhesion protein 1-like [Scomber scombrus]|uniref:Vascular cell adhesion protein 1-like n=1 Tax=Scomber scombrus TaxID=13677 RepID=A0AAV1PPS1_SCOSC
MFNGFVLVIVSVISFLPGFHVVTADENCAEKPVFTPSRLVVKYGDPTSATCLVCQHNCTSDIFGLEHAVGYTEENGTTISWKVDSLTEWDTYPMCYYNDDDDNQCITRLPITVYQPPKNVHLSFINHSGPMFAGHQYTLQCTVQEVAPIGYLNVTFYRGQTELQRRQSNSTTMEPVNETFTMNINPSKDDGGLYWCEAELDLGAEGPQPPPVVTSQNITATVYYKPQLKGSSHPDPITVIAGSPLHLNCSSEGNPSPSYTWRLPSASRHLFSGDTLNIKSVTSVDGGQYMCLVQNAAGNVTVMFTVAFYNPPKKVHLSFLNHSGPMYMGHQYTLQCTVQEVPPIGNLTVTFYHGQTPLGQQNVNKPVETPVNKTFTLDINPCKEDDGDPYWCEAKLDLAAEGLQSPPVVKSQNITATVYYKPQLKGSSHPDPITVTAGSPLHLNCSSEGNPSPSYTWRLPSTSRPPFSGSTLSIEAVTSTDGGQYMCLVQNAAGNVTVKFTVVFYNKPQVKDSPDPERLNVTIGDPLHLNCSSEGNPSPSYTWTLPSTSRPPFSDSTLSIEAVTSTDGGQYICLVSNSVGNVTKEFTVDVKDKPQLKESPDPEQITVTIGDPLHLNCSSEGNPSPSYTWRLPSTSRPPFSDSTLSIEAVTSTDGGQYICLVSNSVGNVTKEFTVDVNEPPKNVYLSFLNHSGPMFAGHQYTLQCTVQEVALISNLNVTFYRGQTELQRRQSSSTTKEPVTETFTLDINPSKDDGGLYWCEAKLELGAEGPQPPPVLTSQNITATVHYKPQLKESPDPERITLTIGDPLHLNCSSEGNPSPSYTWRLPSTSRPPFSDSTLSIEAVTSTDGGQYICLVSNSVGNVTKEFTVDVNVNYIHIIIVVGVVVAVIIIAAFVVWYLKTDIFILCHHHQHVAVPVGE